MTIDFIGLADDGRNISSFVRDKSSSTSNGSDSCRLCFCRWLIITLLCSLCFRPALDVSQLLQFLLKLKCLSYFLILLKHCSSLHDWKVYFHGFCLFLEMCEMPTGQFLQMVWWTSLTSWVGQLISDAKSRKCLSSWFIFCNLLLYLGSVSSGVFNKDWSEWLLCSGTGQTYITCASCRLHWLGSLHYIKWLFNFVSSEKGKKR